MAELVPAQWKSGGGGGGGSRPLRHSARAPHARNEEMECGKADGRLSSAEERGIGCVPAQSGYLDGRDHSLYNR
eukprot:scaffold5458_cov131-Isochrysis_galbana.AAC.11